MGEIYRAEDIKLKRTVALKFLPVDLTRDPKAKKRFIREAQTASTMDHPNICTIHEIDETDTGQLFIAMACYDGETLEAKIERGPLTLKQSLDIAIQVAQGLARAHARGIVHRDITPANIFITEDGQVKILDFGLAKLAGQTKITKEGMTMGTVNYMSPEQARGKELDNQTDIWSLGVVLYEMLTGQLPFKGEHWEAVLYAIFNEEPQMTTTLRSDVPEPLQQVVTNMLQKDPKARYKDTTTIIADLKSVASQSGLSFPVRETREIRKISKLKGILIPVSVFVIVLAAFFLTRTRIFPTSEAAARKPIAVMTFKNLTGESSLDYLSEAIPNLIITNLEQSEYLSVMTWERMRDLLKIMGKEEIESIDDDLGFEVCKMDEIENVVLGSFTKAGDVFVTDAKVLDVKSKRILHSTNSKGKGVASILETQIDELSVGIANGTGVPESEIEAEQWRIAEATTSSMDAYNYYLRGKEESGKFHHDETVKFFEKAIELDSTFAMAYYELSNVYGQLREHGKSRKMLEKARTYGQKATEKERLYIEELYARRIEADYEKQFQILEEILCKYPKEKTAHFLLGWEYYDTEGMYTQAVAELEKALSLDPNHVASLCALTYVYARLGELDHALACAQRYALASPGNADPFDTMGDIYVFMGKLDEAMARYQQAIEIEPSYFYSYKDIAYIYGLKENYAEAQKWMDRHNEWAPATGRKAEGYWWKGLYYYLQGNFKSSLSAFNTAVDMMQEAGPSTTRGLVYWTTGWVCLERGQLDLCRESFKQYIDIFGESPVHNLRYRCCLGLVDMKQGFIDSARLRLSELNDLLRGTESDELAEYLYDLLHAEVLLAQDSADRAIQLCKHGLHSPEFLGTAQIWPAMQHNIHSRRDLLARAYLRKGDLGKAIAEYERLITFDPKGKNRRLIHPIYHYKLAVLYEKKGSTEKAIKEYEKFLEIWKDADQDLPEKTDARMRLGKLLKKRTVS